MLIHQPTYNQETGTTKSYLVSTQWHDVYLLKFDKTFSFFPWESMYTEISQKFDHNTKEQMARKARLGIKKVYTESKRYILIVY